MISETLIIIFRWSPYAYTSWLVSMLIDGTARAWSKHGKITSIANNERNIVIFFIFIFILLRILRAYSYFFHAKPTGSGLGKNVEGKFC